MKHIKLKGKRGELMWKDFLLNHGYEARRGQQYKGTSDSPDVISNLPIHWEVKNTQKSQVHDWLEQSMDDAAGLQTAAVVWKKNHKRWVVILDADDFLELLKSKQIC